MYATRVKPKLYLFANLLIILFGFVLFFDHKASRAILVLLGVLWLVTGDFHAKWERIRSHKLVWTFLLFVGMFVVGLLWTENFYAGRKILERPLLYLIVPIALSMYQRKFIPYYLWSMLLALITTGIMTGLIALGLLDIPYTIDTSPYVHRVYLAGMLIFAYSYFLDRIATRPLVSWHTGVMVLLALLMVYTLEVSGSRMGYINLFIATAIVILYHFRLSWRGVVGMIGGLVLFALLAYGTLPQVKHQVDSTIKVIKTMDLEAQVLEQDTTKRRSLTCRFEFWYYAYQIGRANPLLGVGSGDGILELQRLIGKPEAKQLFKQCLGDGSGQFNPHNMYLFMFMQFGVVGLVLLLWILSTQLRIALASHSAPFVVLIVTTIVTLFSLSELFTSKFFIPFYGYSVMVMYLLSIEYGTPEPTTPRSPHV